MRKLSIYKGNYINIVLFDNGILFRDTEIGYMLMTITYTGLYIYSGIRHGLFDGGIDGRLVVVGVDEI